MSEARLLPKGIRSLPVYTRVALGGLLLLALAPVIGLVANIIQSNSGALPVNVITAILPLAIAGLVSRYGRWALVAAAVYGVLVAAVVVPSYEYGLGNPDSFFDFVPAVVFIGGGLVSLVGGTASFVASRREERPRISTGARERLAFRGVASVLGALVFVSLVLAVTGRHTLADEEKAGATVVRTEGFQFRPDWFAIPDGRINRIVVDNRDLVVHTFTIKALDIHLTVDPKSEGLVELPDVGPGAYTYTCQVPGHDNMKGTLQIS